MLNPKDKSVSLVGYGVSNKSLYSYLEKKGICPVIRSKDRVDIPKGATGVFGDGYLNTEEDIVFRSPGIRPDKISGSGRVLTEAIFSLDISPSFKIGISGSDGKTTTSTLIHKMLSAGNKRSFLCGNIGACVIDFVEEASKKDYLVTELSSFQLMGASPCLDVAVITNISENHLDWHLNMDEYIEAKKGILKNAKKAVLNYDDKLVRSFKAHNCLFFSLQDLSEMVGDKNTYVYVKDGYIYYDEKKLFPLCNIRLKGEFNIKNILCAIGCAYPLVGLEPCYKIASTFSGVENRQEHIESINGVWFVNSAIDSTPSRTLNTLSAYPKEKTIAILGGYDKNLDYECLRDTINSVKGVILCGENKEKISACLDRDFITVNTIEECAYLGLKMAKRGDYVILTPASASFDMFENYKEKAKCFKRAVENLKNGKY